MEELLQRELGCRSVQASGHSGGGCISQGQSYDTDIGRVFVKVNPKSEAKRMFEGEMSSLTAILKTDTVKVPKPIKVLGAPGGGSMLVMEHLDMRYLSSQAAKLGAQLADLHLDNKKLGETFLKEAGTVGKGGGQAERPFVGKFGFDVVTCCGYLPQVNDWQEDWVMFYAQQRIQPQMDMVEKKSGDREALELWSALQQDSQGPWIRAAPAVVPTLPLPEPLEPFWIRVQRVLPEHHAESGQVSWLSL
uniref:protein-ribulosamine 3-kinase n=1 Tax=Marmota marmota marmota TaxID=9994 RepID=A0A8C6ENN1_MARMA